MLYLPASRTLRLALCLLLGLASLASPQSRPRQPPDPKGLTLTPTPGATERRVALVIGNGAYQHVDRLKNPVNDAEDMAKVLRALQFQVILKTDATLEMMAEALFSFGEQLQGGGVGLFYYSGHGMQVKGENFLIPIDADVKREDEMKRKTLSARDVLDKMEEAKSHLNLVFLDACRNNPFPRSVRSAARGLAGMNAPSGTLLVFATNPDNVASDGSGRNGAYTKHLLQQITQPGLEVGMLLRRVRTAVKAETGDQQVPWENGSMEGEFYFVGPSSGPAVPSPQPLPQPLPQPPSPPPSSLRNSLGMEFVRIPAGEFRMGSEDKEAFADEKPVHTVRLTKAFYLGKHEVTQGQWQAVMGSNPSKFTADANRPVEQVSWDDVQEFIRRLNAREGGTPYRLPTEAEWEYAARAGSTTAYSFGNDPGQLWAYAWYGANAGNTTHPVGQKQPNAWGLHDMHGNVWEWVQDWYGAYASGPAVDPMASAAAASRVVRGGSLYRDAGYCRAARRLFVGPGNRGGDLGFRLLREVP